MRGTSVSSFFHFPGGREKELKPFQKGSGLAGFSSCWLMFSRGADGSVRRGKRAAKKTKETTISGIRGQWVLLKNIRLFPCPEQSPSRARRSLSLSKKVGWRGEFLKPLEDVKRGKGKRVEGGLQAFPQASGFPTFPENPAAFLAS